MEKITKGWAKDYINQLINGETVKFRPYGKSMSGGIESGQLCTVAPISSPLEIDDVVLCQVGSQHFLHIIKAIKRNSYKICNNKGIINGWVAADQIYGILVKVE